MSRKTTVIAAVAAVGLLACGLLFALPAPSDAEPISTDSPDKSLFASSWSLPTAPLTRTEPPAAPGGADPRFARQTSSRQNVGGHSDRIGMLYGDRIALDVLGLAFGQRTGLGYKKASRRNVIEHVIQGTAAVGIVTAEPSEQERRLGARDIILGAFEPAMVVHAEQRIRCLAIRDAQALLCGRKSHWPGTREPIRIVGPSARDRAALLAELLTPGDPLAISVELDRPESVLDAVRTDRNAIGIVPRTALPAQHDARLVEFTIPGFQPSKTLRIVFRDSHHPVCAAALSFCRSADGRALLASRMKLR